jgi:hypothetical protein
MRTPTLATRGALLAALTALLLGACTEPEPDTAPDPAFEHVHGLAVDPRDGRLRVATHDGLFVLRDGRPQRIGHTRHDLMGFTIVAEDRFLASGHPATSDLPEPMGLVRSDDGGLTWQQVNPVGQADLHSLDVQDETVAAYDSTTGRVLLSNDEGRTFITLSTLDAVDTALLEEGRVLVAGSDGVLSLVDADGSERLSATPGLVTVDRTRRGVAGLGPEGQVWVSADARTWTGRGKLDGVPAALETGGVRWYAATSTGIYASSDGGATWKRLA